MHPPAQSPLLGVSSSPRAARFSRQTEANTNSKELGQSSPQKTNQHLAKRRDAQIETSKDRGTAEDRGTVLLRERDCDSTGRMWSCKWDDAPLAESFLPPVPNSAPPARNALPRAHNDERSRNQEILLMVSWREVVRMVKSEWCWSRICCSESASIRVRQSGSPEI